MLYLPFGGCQVANPPWLMKVLPTLVVDDMLCCCDTWEIAGMAGMLDAWPRAVCLTNFAYLPDRLTLMLPI
jgi:hypothetical protein